MDSAAWDERYRAVDLVWGSEPNRFVAEALGAREPAGRALDLACGEGRNAIWLAQRGWRVTGVDYSPVAIARAHELAGTAGVRGHTPPQPREGPSSRRRVGTSGAMGALGGPAAAHSNEQSSAWGRSRHRGGSRTRILLPGRRK